MKFQRVTFSPWISIGLRCWLDDHSFGIHAQLAPLIDCSIEVYFARNYWVHRGFFVSLLLLGLFQMESDPAPGEATYTDEEGVR